MTPRGITLWPVLSAALALCAPALRAQSDGLPAEARFNLAYKSLTLGDEARDRGDQERAVHFYKEALRAYIRLASRYPDWQPGVVKFRIAYCDNQLEAILKEVNMASGPEGSPDAVAAPMGKVSRPPPQSSEARQRVSRARSLLLVDQPQRARELLLEAMQTEPDHPTIRMLLGAAQCQLGEYDDARFLLRQLVEEVPHFAEARVALGTAHAGLGRMGEAAAELRQAAALKPSLPCAHFNLAQVLMRAVPPRIEEAREHYRRALELGTKPDPELNRLLE